MSICKPCADAGDRNRKIFNGGALDEQKAHPEDCGCPCMHHPATDWPDMYGSPAPDGKD